MEYILEEAEHSDDVTPPLYDRTPDRREVFRPRKRRRTDASSLSDGASYCGPPGTSTDVAPDALERYPEQPGTGAGPSTRSSAVAIPTGSEERPQDAVGDGSSGAVHLSGTSRCKRVIITRHCLDVGAAREWVKELSSRTGSEEGRPFRYFHGQTERAPNTGRIHVQAVVCSWKQLRFGSWKRALGAECHIEGVRDWAAAVRYCHKSESRCDDPFSFGEPPVLRQGTRSDLGEVKNSILNGTSTWDLMNNHFDTYARYGKFFAQFKQMYEMRARRSAGFSSPEVFIYWGASGMGKSRRAEYEAKEKYGVHGYYRLTGKWFDSYDGEKALIIDEFVGHLAPTFLLQLLDGYPVLLPQKHAGAMSQLRSIWITSNANPDSWWPKLRTSPSWTPEWDAALRRRATTVVHFNANHPWSPPDASVSTTQELDAITSAQPSIPLSL